MTTSCYYHLSKSTWKRKIKWWVPPTHTHTLTWSPQQLTAWTVDPIKIYLESPHCASSHPCILVTLSLAVVCFTWSPADHLQPGQGVWTKTSKAEAALSSCTWSLCTQDTVVVCLCGSRILGPSWLSSYLYVICVTLSRVCWVLTVRTVRLKSSRRFLLHSFIVPMPVLNIIPQLWGHCLHVRLCHSRLLSKELRWRKTEPSSTM